MTVTEAEDICRRYYELTNPDEEEQFLYTEALQYLIREKKDPGYMNDLGAFYYGQRNFDLALKYYEMAAEAGDITAISNLGYIWYYGRTGEKNYEKAFHYFKEAAEMGDLPAAYKVADMYKNGYLVEKNPEKYKSMIEGLYRALEHKHPLYLSDPLPEVYTRLAAIRTDEGKTGEALSLYDRAREFLAQRIREDPYFGNLNIMKWMIRDIYRLRKFDPEKMDLYDLYEVLQEPHTVRFTFENGSHEVQAVSEEGGMSIRFDDHWYHTIEDFFSKAELDREHLTTLYDELRDYEVLGWNL